jgi:hypothetical protein
VAPAHAAQAADAPAARDAAFEFAGARAGGFTLGALALGFRELHLRALDALHAGSFFLLEELAPEGLGAHVYGGALGGGGHGGGLGVLEDAD